MTIINFKRNFIFVHPSRTAGSSLIIALLKYCDGEDIVCDDILKYQAKPWVPEVELKRFNPKFKKKLNIGRIRAFLSSFIKILPFIDKFKKFNYPPDFSLNFPLIVSKPIVYNHASIHDIKKITPNYFFENAYKFTIVRNPYTQFLSFYQKSDKKKNLLNFAKKYAKYFFNREISHFYQDISIYNKIIKFENLSQGLKELSYELGFQNNIYDDFKKIRASSNSKNMKKNKDILKIDPEIRGIIYSNAKKIFDDFGYEKI